MLKLWSIAGYRNFGDALSPVLIQEMIDAPVVSTDSAKSEMVAVGSLFAFGHCLYREQAPIASKDWLKIIRLRLIDAIAPVVHVWGTGFLYEKIPACPIVIRTLNLHAVRGKYTLDILKRTGLFSGKTSIAYGDPGLFYSALLPEIPKKEYDLGVVPHEVDRYAGEFVVEVLSAHGMKVKYIDVYDNPLKVVSEIAACDCILSSSLHGLIVADSLGIPNRQMMLSYFGYTKDQYLFKYRDYYSAYDMELPDPLTPQDVFAVGTGIVNNIRKGFIVDRDKVNSCREGLMSSFPFRISRPTRWSAK